MRLSHVSHVWRCMPFYNSLTLCITPYLVLVCFFARSRHLTWFIACQTFWKITFGSSHSCCMLFIHITTLEGKIWFFQENGFDECHLQPIKTSSFVSKVCCNKHFTHKNVMFWKVPNDNDLVIIFPYSHVEQGPHGYTSIDFETLKLFSAFGITLRTTTTMIVEGIVVDRSIMLWKKFIPSYSSFLEGWGWVGVKLVIWMSNIIMSLSFRHY